MVSHIMIAELLSVEMVEMKRRTVLFLIFINIISWGHKTYNEQNAIRAHHVHS